MCRSGQGHPEAHSKRSNKYYYVMAGQVRFGLNGVRFDLVPGDVCIVQRGQRFWYEWDAEESTRLLLVHSPSFDSRYEVFTEAQ